MAVTAQMKAESHVDIGTNQLQMFGLELGIFAICSTIISFLLLQKIKGHFS